MHSPVKIRKIEKNRWAYEWISDQAMGRADHQWRLYVQAHHDPQAYLQAKIFLNTKGRLGDIDNSIRAFLQYVDGVMTADRFVQEIDEEIQKVKRIEGEAVSYMTYEMKIKEERKEERKETRREDIRRLISKLKISAEQAMDLLEIPQAERQLYKSAF